MADVVLSAKMSNEELLKSIDATLKSSEQKFTDFATDINSILKGIGTNMGQNLSTNFGSQIDAMKLKIDELNSKIKSMGTPTPTVGASTPASVNVNDYNGNIVGNLQQQDEAIKTLSANYKQLELNAKNAANAQRNALKMDISVATKLPTNNLDEANEKLRRLQELKSKIASTPTQLLNPSEIQSIDTKIANLTHRIETLQARVKQPLTMTNVMGMSEGSLNEITAKMTAINNLRGNYGKGAPELTQLNQAYQRLGNAQTEALASGVILEKQNNKIASSFENLGKRVMFYAGLGAITGFVTQLFNIRGEYEMLERSMGALLGNFQKGYELFNKIQAQALKSPLTVLDLAGAAKQLVAYNFAEDQVAETTKRLADLSTALGVPIERLTYNLGQIKSKNVLDARDARDFANAGFAIVPMLAQLYTQQKKFGDQAVTTAQVYDMMTKKMVSYGDVMDVINKQTSDGGMFFDFQAKQAQTLKGQLSNLVDAWNMMLNEMGKDNQGVMTGMVSGVRSALSNWREIERAITGLVIAYGTYKTAQLVVNNLFGEGNIALTNSIRVSKLKMASDLEMAGLTRTLTAEERTFIDTKKEVTAQDYAAALSTKSLSKAQASLLVILKMRNAAFVEGIIKSGALTEAEVAQLSATRGLTLGWKMLTLSLKSFWESTLLFLKNNWILLTLMGVASAISYISNKHEEQKQKLQEVNDEYNNLRKNIADISVNFQVALQDKSGKGLDEAKTQLNELIKLAKDQYNITFNIDTSKIDAKQIVPVFNKIKSELDDLAISARAFSDSALQSNIGDKFEKYGQDIQKVYDTIIGNKGSVIDALQSHIHKLQELGGQQKEVQAEQSVLNNLLKPKQENESLVDYLNRLTTAYNQLGIVGSNTNPFDKAYDQLRKLGISGDETFQTLNDELKKMSSSGGDAIGAFDKQVEELAKRINFDRLPKDQRTIKLEAAINKYATDKNLNEWSREVMIALANQKYHVNISTLVDKKSQNQASLDLMNWRDNLQDYFNKHGFQVGVDLKTATAGEIAQKAGTEYEARKASVKALELQLAYSKSQLSIEERKLKNLSSTSKEYASQSEKVKSLKDAVSTLPKEIKKANDEVTSGRAAAARSGYDFKKENKEAEKAAKQRAAAQRKALSEEAQAVQNEISLIDKLSSNYDKLTGAGMSKETAISFLAKEYKRSIGDINNVLTKYKLPKFDVSTYITETAGKGLSGQVAYLEKLRDAMKSKGLDKLKPDAFKQVSLQIEKIKVEGKVYDMTMITDGLQNALNNIKESYELGVEFGADPQMGELFTNVFKINKNDLIRTADDAVKALQDEWNKKTIDYNKLNPQKQIGATNLMTTTPADLAKSLGLTDSSKIIQEYKNFYDYARKVRMDDYKSVTKNWDDLLSKYAEYEYKKEDIQKTAAKQRLELIQKFGTQEEYKQALDLSDRIQISQDPIVISDLQKQLSDLVDKVGKQNKQIVPIAAAITTKATQDTGALEWEKFKKSDLYANSFEEMDRVATSSIQAIMDEMDKLKNKMGTSLSPEQMKAFMQAYKQARDEFEKRAPFETIVTSLKDWAKATENKKIADVDLVNAENELTLAQNRLSNAYSKAIQSGHSAESEKEIANAQDGVAQATDRVTSAKKRQLNADNDFTQAQAKLQKSLTSAQGVLNQVSSGINQFMELFDINKESEFGKGLTALAKGFGLVATALGIIITVAVLAELSLGWVAIVAASLATIIGMLSWIGGQSNGYEQMKNVVEDLANAINKAADKMTAFLEKSAGEKALSYYRTLIKNNDAIIQSYRDLAEEAGKAGSSWGSHSYAYRTNRALSDSFNDMGKLIGKNITQIQDLYGLSSSDLETIMTQMPTAWAKIDKGIREALENIITYGDKATEYTNELAEALTGVSFDDLSSNFMDMLSNLDSTTEDFANNFEKYMRNAIIHTLVYGDEFQAELQNWYTQFREYMADGVLSDAEKAVLKENYDTLVEQARKNAKAAEEAAGISTTSDSKLSSLQQGIQNVSEDTAGAIESYMNGISGQIYLHTNILQKLYDNSEITLGIQSRLLLQMQQGYQVQLAIQNILNGTLSNSGRSFMVTLTT